MKTLKLLFSTAVLALCVGCTTSDEALINLQDNNSLNHSWSLHRISGGFAGIDITYPFGQVTWTFNESTGILTVQNNIITAGPEDVYAGHETGTYTYHIEVTNGDSVLFIDNLERGMISVSSEALNIDDGVAADGMFTEFEKVTP